MMNSRASLMPVTVSNTQSAKTQKNRARTLPRGAQLSLEWHRASIGGRHSECPSDFNSRTHNER
eukprot:6177926-Pleurochrysis_carterae.AAC.6